MKDRNDTELANVLGNICHRATVNAHGKLTPIGSPSIELPADQCSDVTLALRKYGSRGTAR